MGNIPVPGSPGITVSPAQTGYLGSGTIDQPSGPLAGFATATITVGGTFSTSSLLNVTINGHLVAYQVVSGDTNLNGAATSLVAAINADSTDNVIVSAGAPTAGVFTITALNAGSTGMYSIAVSVTGGTVTLTLANSATELDLAGGTVIFNQTVAYGFNTFYAGEATNVDAGTKAALRASGVIY